MTFILKIKLQKYMFYQIMTIFEPVTRPFWTPVRMEIYKPRSQPKFKMEEFTVNCENKKQEIGTQVTFISENKLYK